jgi:hypothetical protein
MQEKTMPPLNDAQKKLWGQQETPPEKTWMIEDVISSTPPENTPEGRKRLQEALLAINTTEGRKRLQKALLANPPGMPSVPPPPQMFQQRAAPSNFSVGGGIGNAFGQGFTFGTLAPIKGAYSAVNPFSGDDSPGPNTGGSFMDRTMRGMTDRYLNSRDESLTREEQFTEEHPYLQFAGELGGGVVGGLLTGGGSLEAQAAKAALQAARPAATRTALGAALRGGLQGAGYGALSGAGHSKGLSFGEIGEDAAKGAVGGLVGGLVTSGGIQGGANLLSKFKNRNTVKLPNQLKKEAEEMMEAGQKTFDDSKSASDAILSESTKFAEEELARNRKALAQAITPTPPPPSLTDSAEKQILDRVVSSIKAADDRLPEVPDYEGNKEDYHLFDSLLQKNKETSDESETLYKKLSREAEGLGNTTLDYFSEVLAEENARAGSFINPKNKSFLQSIKDRIFNKDTELDNEFSFAEVSRGLSHLKEIIRSKYSAEHGAIADSDTPALIKLQKALQKDYDGFIGNNEALRKAAEEANEHYRTSRVPFLESDVSDAFKATDIDQIFAKLTSNKGGDQARRIFSLLDDTGKAAMKSKLLSGLLKDASDPLTNKIDIKKLGTQLKNNENLLEVFFKGDPEGLAAFSKRVVGEETAAKTAAEAAAETAKTAEEKLVAEKNSAIDKATGIAKISTNAAEEELTKNKKASGALTKTAAEVQETLDSKVIKAKLMAALLSVVGGGLGGGLTRGNFSGVREGAGLGVGGAFIANQALDSDLVKRMLLSKSTQKPIEGVLPKALTRYIGLRSGKNEGNK